MELLPISFLAGLLTVLAPCILPMLPIIIGGSLSDANGNKKVSIMRPLVVTMSLGFSIILFTLLLKATTAFIAIPDAFWKWFSATIILAFAFTLLFPHVWAKIQALLSQFLPSGGIKDRANKQLATSSKDESFLGAFLIGIALGPVFAACSPTYFLILGTVLPASFGIGLLNLFAYALGLAVILLAIAFAGQKMMGTLNIAANPDGWFKKGMGVLFLIVAIAIITGVDKKFESTLVEKGYGVTTIEKDLLQGYTTSNSDDARGEVKKFPVRDYTQPIPLDTKQAQPVIEEVGTIVPEAVGKVTKEIVNKKEVTKVIKKAVRVTEVSGKALPIPSSEILAGGPPKDGIPPLDKPSFISAAAATYLNPIDEGVGIVDSAGVATFYPFRVLVWHEIVNTQVAHNGQNNFPVSITYCPLCKTAIVFEGMVDGVATTFGTSGKLWQSNLLMYDRNADESKESLWSQVLGTAVRGPATGIKLAIYPSTITTFNKWRSAHSQTRVLSKDTGYFRDYSQSPYGGYDESTEVYFPTNFSDTQTHPKTLVLGLEIEGNYIAFEKEKIKTGKSEVTFAGTFISINRSAGDTITFTNSTINEPFSYIEGFWFSWQAVHPGTVLR